MVSYKKRYEALLREQHGCQVKTHEGRYLHVPRPAWKPLLGSIIGLLLCGGYAFILIAVWNALEVSRAFAAEPAGLLQQLGIVPCLLFAWLLAAGTIVSVAALCKGGYDRLKPYERRGLIWGLIAGLIQGLIFLLILGILGGLIAMLGGAILGGVLIVWLIVGLIGGLIGGLIIGLDKE